MGVALLVVRVEARRVDHQFDRGYLVQLEGAVVALTFRSRSPGPRSWGRGTRRSSASDQSANGPGRLREWQRRQSHRCSSNVSLVVGCERCRQPRARVGDASSPDSCDFCADRDRACHKARVEHAEFLGREIELSSVAACRARDLVRLNPRSADGRDAWKWAYGGSAGSGTRTSSGSGTVWRGSRRHRTRAPRHARRARWRRRSIRITAGSSLSVIIRQSVSPCTPGRSPSRTITS